MDMDKVIKTGLTVAGVGIGLCAGAAQANVIGNMPNADFGDTPYTLSLAGGAASYTFSNIGSGSFNGVAVQTGDNAQLASNEFAGTDGQPIGFQVDTSPAPPTIRGDVGTFLSFDNPTNVYPRDTFGNQSEAFLGLKLNLSDGSHVGYARFNDDNTLLSYGYQSDPNTEIVAGATSGANTPVPGPTSIAIFGLALSLLGFGAATGRRRRG